MQLREPRPFPRMLVALVVAIAVVNAFADVYYWYWRMRWFDAPMHFSGGVWLAGTALWWRFFSGHFDIHAVPRGSMHIARWGVGAALGIGLVWEVYEAVVSLATVGHINPMPDTLGDLFFDTVGGVVVSVAVWMQMKNNV